MEKPHLYVSTSLPMNISDFTQYLCTFKNICSIYVHKETLFDVNTRFSEWNTKKVKQAQVCEKLSQ